MKKYLVGGAVRDLLLEKEPKDYDFAVEAESFEAMVEELKRDHEIFQVNERFLTVRAKNSDGMVSDYVLCRQDGEYLDGRRPTEVTPGTIMHDLARRDFTINAMAMDESGNIIDPFSGQRDLKDGLLRAVGDPLHRCAEDGLRIIRALRFSVTLNMSIESTLARIVSDRPDLLSGVSVERKREELAKMFAHDTLVSMMALNQCNNGMRKAIFEGIRLQPTMKENIR